MFHAMLDTNTCIRVIRDKPQNSRNRFIEETGKLAISSIVLHELHTGVLRSYAPEKHKLELEEFLPQPGGSAQAAIAAHVEAGRVHDVDASTLLDPQHDAGLAAGDRERS